MSFRAKAKFLYDPAEGAMRVEFEYLAAAPHTQGPPFYWEYTAAFLPWSENLHIILSVSPETRIPEIIYLNRFPPARRGTGEPPALNYMCGWVADIHDRGPYYTAPIIFEKLMKVN